MKIALCLSGLPRFWDRLDLSDYGDNEISVFIHGWRNKTNNTTCLEKLYPKSKADKYRANSDLIQELKPANFLFENSKYKSFYFKHLYSKFRNCEGSSRQSVIPMYYGIQKSIELALDSGKKFDIIVRSRFDIKWIQPLKFEINDFINIADQFHYYGVCDQFAYGSPENMEKYSKVYEYLEKCLDIQLNPEIILKDYLSQQNLQTNLVSDEFVLLR